MAYYDDITWFRHIRSPHVSIQTPKHYIRIYLKSNNKLLATYGCAIVPEIKELYQTILPSRVFDLMGHTFSTTLDINIDDYIITIDGHQVTEQ